MKLLKGLFGFILAHLPRILRFAADHVDDVVDECSVCAEMSDYPCDDSPLRKEVLTDAESSIESQ